MRRRPTRRITPCVHCKIGTFGSCGKFHLCPWRQKSILFGGPPVQGFSTSNQRTRSNVNKDNWMFREFMRLAKSWRPDWIVFENVKGIAETEGGQFLEMVVQGFRRLGYTVSHDVLNAAKFGVPQKRDRHFVVGSFHGAKFTFPTATLSRPISVWHALSDLPDLPNGANTDLLPYDTRPDLLTSGNCGTERRWCVQSSDPQCRFCAQAIQACSPRRQLGGYSSDV